MLRKVRLESAWCHDFPEGSRRHAYELALPITAAGKLDRAGFDKDQQGSDFVASGGTRRIGKGFSSPRRAG